MALDKLSSISVIGTRQYYTTHKRLDAYFVHPEKIDAYSYIRNIAENKGFKISDLESLLMMKPESGRGAKEQDGSVMVVKPGLLSSDFLIDTDRSEWTSDDDFSTSEKGQLKRGDILILSAAHAAGYIGKNTSIFLTSDDNKAICIGELIRLRPDDKRINPYYLLAYLNNQKIRLFFQYSVRGQTVHLYPNDIRKIPVILPPRKIQDNIGNILRQSIEAKLEAKKKKKEIDEIFAKYLPAFPKEDKLSMRINKEEAQSLKRMDPTMFSPFIKYVFREIKKKSHFYLKDKSECIFFRGKTPAEKDYVDEGIVVIKVGSINENGELTLKTKKSCLPDAIARIDYKNVFVTRNDIIFVATGKGSIGKVTIFTGDDNKCVISGEMLGLRCSGDQFLPFVIGGFFLSNIGKRILDTIAIGPTGQTHLYPKDLKNVPIPNIHNYEKQKIKDAFLYWYNSLQESKIFHQQAMSELGKLLSIEGGL